MPYLSASEMMIHEKALYQVHVPLPLPLRLLLQVSDILLLINIMARQQNLLNSNMSNKMITSSIIESIK